MNIPVHTLGQVGCVTDDSADERLLPPPLELVTFFAGRLPPFVDPRRKVREVDTSRGLLAPFDHDDRQINLSLRYLADELNRRQVPVTQPGF